MNKNKQSALEYAKKRKAEIVGRRIFLYPPATIFMAGSSGAGKTEVAKRIAGRFNPEILRIDPDDLREEFPEYDGKNASIFQESVTFLAKEIYLAALKKGINLVFDGTFSDFARLDEYIRLSLAKGRRVAVVYVHQNPVIAWNFVCSRAKKEGRTVPKGRHVKSYFGARDSVSAAKTKYGGKVELSLVLKNDDGTIRKILYNVPAIDKHIPDMYNIKTLTEKLNNEKA